jgi:hypothetical protein
MYFNVKKAKCFGGYVVPQIERKRADVHPAVVYG